MKFRGEGKEQFAAMQAQEGEKQEYPLTDEQADAVFDDVRESLGDGTVVPGYGKVDEYNSQLYLAIKKGWLRWNAQEARLEVVEQERTTDSRDDAADVFSPTTPKAKKTGPWFGQAKREMPHIVAIRERQKEEVWTLLAAYGLDNKKFVRVKILSDRSEDGGQRCILEFRTKETGNNRPIIKRIIETDLVHVEEDLEKHAGSLATWMAAEERKLSSQ